MQKAKGTRLSDRKDLTVSNQHRTIWNNAKLAQALAALGATSQG
jgi:hypothetical protein